MTEIIIHLPDDLLRRVKKCAAADGTTVDQFIHDRLDRACADDAAAVHSPERALDRQHYWFPVSTRSGGVRPGVDLIKTAALLGQEDEERYGAGGKQYR